MKRIEVGMLCYIVSPAKQKYIGRVVEVVEHWPADEQGYEWRVAASWIVACGCVNAFAQSYHLLPISAPDATDSERKPETVSA